MKTLNLIFALLIASFVFSQNRNKLLKEIQLYKAKTINNSSFPTTKDSLQTILNNYLKNDGFIFHSKTDSGAVYNKTLSCFGENQFIGKGANKHNRPFARNFFVTISFKTINNRISPVFSSHLRDSYINKPLKQQALLSNNGTQSLPIDKNRQTCYYGKTIFNFNESVIKQFLYAHFYGSHIAFTEELNTKIENHNAQQTKGKKKLIAGRDY